MSHKPKLKIEIEDSFKMDVLRIELLSRGISKKRFAAGIGVAHCTLKNFMTAGFLGSEKARLKAEDFLGKPIWSSAKDFSRRHEMIRRFGVNTDVASCRELRAVARQKNISLFKVPFTKKAVLKAVLIHLRRSKNSINPKPNQP